MSDIEQPGTGAGNGADQNQTTTTTAIVGPPPPEATITTDGDLAGRVSQLESRVSALESSIHTAGTAPVPVGADGFDHHAYVDALVGQGVPEEEAVKEADYRQTLWNDQHAVAQ